MKSKEGYIAVPSPPPNLDVVANFGNTAKCYDKGFSATVDETLFKKFVAHGFARMWIDLFSGVFDNTVSKNAAIQLNYFYCSIAVRAHKKHFLYRH